VGEEGRFAYDGLERVMHEKARLGILASLTAHPDGLLFNELRELCALTDGNLSRHLTVLREAGMIEVWKRDWDARPQTLVKLSDEGHARFLAYVEELERVVADAMGARGAHPGPSEPGSSRPGPNETGGLSPA